MTKNKRSLTYFSMFTGVGGFELGIQRAFSNRQIQYDDKDNKPCSAQSEGTQPSCVGVCEIDTQCSRCNKEGRGMHQPHTLLPTNTSKCDVCGKEKNDYASAVLQHRFPEVKNYGDATKINAEELPDFDLLVGGFPCQAFSVAGNRRGFNDTRGTLFFEIARIVKQKQPRFLVLENVKGLLSHDQGKTFHTIIATLDELGYALEWQVLNSKNHGVPQNRERVFIIGRARGNSTRKIFPFTGENTEDTRVVGQDTSVCLDANYYKGASAKTLAKQQRQHIEIKQLNNPKYSQQRVYDPTGIGVAIHTAMPGKPRVTAQSPTLTTPTGGGHLPYIATNCRIRRLTPIECERLQGFPDNWTRYGVINGEVKEMSQTQRYKMMGNAVTVNVVKDIIKELVKEVLGEWRERPTLNKDPSKLQ